MNSRASRTFLILVLSLASCVASCHSIDVSRDWFPTAPLPTQKIDLTPFARVTATATRNTFLLLWPRETEDAAFTVRDGAAQTSWKIPATGTHSLQIDFAPLLHTAPGLATIEACWNTLPAGAVRVMVSPYCGGPVTFDTAWKDPVSPFSFEQPLRAGCLSLELTDPGPAALSELKVYAADLGESPTISEAAIHSADHGLRVSWTANQDAGFIRIDYLNHSGERLSEETCIEVVPAINANWYGPQPVSTNGRIALTPLSFAGVPGRTVLLTPPEGSDLHRLNPMLGTIEGFYGTPWSDGERRRMMVLLARLGFGSYLYQPKWDPLNREQWRIPYSDQEISAFAALRRFGERLGVTMIFGLAPAFDMAVDDPNERAILLQKLAPLVEAGFRDFELGFDDIEFSVSDPVDAVMAAKHVDLVNWTQDRLSEMAGELVGMWMMPTAYSTDRQYNSFPAGSAYVDQLANLHEGTHILWNGPDTFAREIRAADLTDVTDRTGRKPVIWENMHCNDAGDAFIGKLYLAPIMNRAVDLPQAIEGFLTNPLILGAANRLVYGSYAQYFADPTQYDPNRAMPESIGLEVVEETDRALALRLSENYWGLGILGPPGNSVTHNLPMEEAMRALRDVYKSPDLQSIVRAAARLLSVAAQMVSTQNDLHHSGFRTDLVDDLWYPAERLVDEGRAILHLLDWLGERLAGRDNPVALQAAKQIIVDSLLHDRYHTSLFQLMIFVLEMERATIVAQGFEPLPLAEPQVLHVRVGDLWVYDAGVSGEIQVHGLRGATLNGSVINWLPPHAGTYHALVTVGGETGWAWREFVLTVTP